MDLKIIYKERIRIRKYLIAGAVIGALFGCTEYIVRIKANYDPLQFIPLIVRSVITGTVISGTVIVFELLFKDRFTQRPFLSLVLARSFVYTAIITFWLSVINGVWFVINKGASFREELINYFINDAYLINLISISLVVILGVGLGQINSLHKKGELLNFVLGKYHKPREVERIFCFIDLKGSTTIAEKLGHFRFALFLKDYYSDIREALQKTNAQVYQYVGDEIILSWPYENGLRDNNAINCFFQMKKIINSKKPKYISQYRIIPEFKAGLHGGRVTVTWVGEMKKEIVYLGDVLNTASRIQEDCKRLAKDFLISEDILNSINDLGSIKATFVEETIPRGKAKPVKLYSLELTES
jgi:adenylate cyclase